MQANCYHADVFVSSPVDLHHGVHVDHNFAWHVTDPDVSIRLNEKIGERFVRRVGRRREKKTRGK